MAHIYDTRPLNISDRTNTRVIRIDRSNTGKSDGKHTIACKMHVISLDAALPYVALSYMWGDPASKREILLNGKPFLVGSNLFDFLTMITEEGYNQLFWIDALCINQDDTTERNHQVALMARIYANAKHVIVWLGTGDAKLFQALRDLESWVESQSHPQFRATSDENTVFSQRHESVSTLIEEQPYWERAWIVQELILAREFSIRFGKFSIPGARFIQYLEYLASPVDIGNAQRRRIWRIVDKSTPVRILRERKLWQSDTKHYIQPWQSHYRAKCSDVRDRIYSMVAFMDPDIRIIPDYNKTSSELFADLVSHHLSDKGTDRFFITVWNLFEILELDQNNEVLGKLLWQWGVLDGTNFSAYTRREVLEILLGWEREPSPEGHLLPPRNPTPKAYLFPLRDPRPRALSFPLLDPRPQDSEFPRDRSRKEESLLMDVTREHSFSWRDRVKRGWPMI